MPNPEPQPRRIQRPRSNATESNQDASENDNPRSGRNRFENLADPDKSESKVVEPELPTIKTLHVDLSLEKSHWESTLDVPHPAPALTFVGIDSPRGFSLNLEPASGALSTDASLTVGFVQFAGFQLRLRLKQPGDATCHLVGDWRLTLPTGEIPFSWVRIRRQERFLEKQFDTAKGKVQAAEAEKRERQQFIDSYEIKRLDTVGKAKHRIQQIDAALTGLRSGVTSAEAELESFRRSVGNVQELEENASLLIRYQSDAIQDNRAVNYPKSG